MARRASDCIPANILQAAHRAGLNTPLWYVGRTNGHEAHRDKTLADLASDIAHDCSEADKRPRSPCALVLHHYDVPMTNAKNLLAQATEYERKAEMLYASLLAPSMKVDSYLAKARELRLQAAGSL